MPVLTLPSGGTSSLTVRAKALVFQDPRSIAVLSRIEQVAPSEATVLLTGETGTGKEIVARQIHQLSRRSHGPFIAVNCGAFSENLVESELFGHEKGAFTGALQANAGWFEAASGGSLFLDEVGDLPLSLQVKLLRVLQENEVVRLGSRQAIPIDVRLIAATNVDLQEAMAAGHFREDLFYRLNVVAVSLPPLRERPGDIAALASYFLDLYRRRLGMEEVDLSSGALQRLMAHAWPGNIRELENTMHHALLICRNGRIEAEDVRVTAPTPMQRSRSGSTPPPPSSREAPTEASAFRALETALEALYELGVPELHERVEQTLLRSAYNYSEQNQLQTARLLGMSRNVVRARLIQFGEVSGRLRNPLIPSERPAPEPAYANYTHWSELTQGAQALENSNLDVAASGVVRIGYQKFGQLLLVKALGDLDRAVERRGRKVEWLEFPGGLQLVDALQSGQLDLGVVGECPPVFAQAAAVPIVYLAAEASAPEAEAILVQQASSIRSVRDLRGKTVALNRGANVHYLLIRALEEAGLSYADIRVTFLVPEEAERAFVANAVDAWAIWDPLLGSVRRQTGARILRDGRGLAQNNAYYVARRELVTRAPDLIEEVLVQVEQAARYARSHTAAAARLLANDSGMHLEALEHWLSRLSGATRMNPTHVLAQQEVADSLFRLKLVPQAVRVADAQRAATLAV